MRLLRLGGIYTLGITATFIVALNVYASMQLQQPRTLEDLRDQVIYNTARIDNVIKAFEILQAGGSNQDYTLISRINVVDNRIDNLQSQIDALRGIVYGSLAFAVIQFTALISFGLKAWFGWLNRQSTKVKVIGD